MCIRVPEKGVELERVENSFDVNIKSAGITNTRIYRREPEELRGVKSWGGEIPAARWPVQIDQ